MSLKVITSEAAVKESFFRQSGWLMIANIMGGMMMWAVHFLTKFIPVGEYGNFGVFLAVIMVLPTIPLQMVLAQQTAKSLASNTLGQLAGVIRSTLYWTSGIWLIGAILVLTLQDRILQHWNMPGPAGIYLTLPIILMSLLLPIFWGVLQGQQNFLWLGWSMMLNGLCRFAIAAAAVLLFKAYAVGMLIGVLLGIALAFGVSVWQTRALWVLPRAPFQGHALRNQIIPLVLGFLALQILFTADTIFVGFYFSKEETGFYQSAGTLSRALLWLVLPLAAVMFPRLVQSAARSEKTNLVGLVLIGSGILSSVGALCVSFMGPWLVKFVFTQEFVKVASSILPWYTAAMIPLAMANVLLNDLLSKPDSALVPAICVFLVAVGYMLALTQFHDSLKMVLQVICCCNIVFLATCGFFSWHRRSVRKTGIPATA